MKIDMYKYLQTGKFIEHAILMCLTEGQAEKFPKYKNKKIKPLDITFTINGKKADLRDFFEHMEQQFDHSVSTKAKKMFEERMSDKMSKVYGSMDALQQYAEHLSEQIDWNV